MKKTTRNLMLIALTVFSISATVQAQPTVGAPAPPALLPSNVISIFSDAYSNVAGTDFNPFWGQSTVVTTSDIGGNNTLVYTNLNYQGTQLTGSVNAKAMDKLHIDIWTANSTLFQITPISPGPKEKLYTLTPLTQNSWNSFDIDLSVFTGVDMAEVFQFKVVGNGTVYIDNLMFYNSANPVDTEAPTAFTASLGSITSDAVELVLNATDNSGAVNFEITYGTTTVSTGSASGVEKKFSVGGLKGSTAYSFSVVAKDAAGNASTNSPIVIEATTAASIPAAPVPTRPAANVISIFSDSYQSATPNANYFPGWGQSTVATIVILGDDNNALKYSNLNYMGMELATSVNAGAMSFLHLDVYTENETSLEFTPISQGHEKLTALSPLEQNKWNSYDIPLSTYTGVVFSEVFQFKTVGSGGKTIFIDNIYFHDGTTSVSTATLDRTVKVYPTMATEQLTIESEKTISRISIHNLLGQQVSSVDLNTQRELLDIQSLPAGHYSVSIQLADGQMVTEKIIKR